MYDSGNTAWLLIATALVMLMTPALAFFYGGLVRRKNVLSTIMHSFFILALISVQWVLWGFTMAFGPDQGGLGIIGGFDFFGLMNLPSDPAQLPYTASAKIPPMLFVAFQMTFAIITPALITGAFAERKRFKAFVIFSLVWATLVYAPVAHWVWSTDGWLLKMGALDFAGGTVVHITSGFSALVAALVLGRRRDIEHDTADPHDLPMTVLGAGLLWFGWFGFNAGSALAADGLAANAFIVTNTAAAMGALTWMTVSWAHKGHPSVLGAAAGAVAGLVGITPAAGFVNVPSSILIGLGAGVLCYFAVQLVKRLGIDDALDVWGVHGIGGVWGAIATGIFASTAVNPAGRDGLLAGNPMQVLIQIAAVIVTILYACVITFVALKVINLFVGLRVEEKEEVLGLDASQHGEAAYQL